MCTNWSKLNSILLHNTSYVEPCLMAYFSLWSTELPAMAPLAWPRCSHSSVNHNEKNAVRCISMPYTLHIHQYTWLHKLCILFGTEWKSGFLAWELGCVSRNYSPEYGPCYKLGLTLKSPFEILHWITWCKQERKALCFWQRCHCKRTCSFNNWSFADFCFWHIVI